MSTPLYVQFPGFCFRLLPKCLLAKRPRLNNRLKPNKKLPIVFLRMIMFVCKQRLTLNLQSAWLFRTDNKFFCVVFLTLLIFCISSRTTLGDSSTPTHFSKLWATCYVLGMACTPQWEWQTSGWPSSAWLLVQHATPCLSATPQR